MEGISDQPELRGVGGGQFGRPENRRLIKHADVDPTDDRRASWGGGRWMDEERKKLIAYEYLCHLQEAKQWLEACIKEPLPEASKLEAQLRNGVALAKLARFFSAEYMSNKKIFDEDESVFNTPGTGGGLKFRHTDNISHWRKAMEIVGLPSLFYPTTPDLYDKKNLPKVIHCIHALSYFLYRKGIAPKMEDLVGKVEFTDEEISNMHKALMQYGVEMPSFSKIGGLIAKELPEDEADMHAAIIAINKAIESGSVENTYTALNNGAARLTGVSATISPQLYFDLLKAQKDQKLIAFLEKAHPEAFQEEDLAEEPEEPEEADEEPESASASTDRLASVSSSEVDTPGPAEEKPKNPALELEDSTLDESSDSLAQDGEDPTAAAARRLARLAGATPEERKAERRRARKEKEAAAEEKQRQKEAERKEREALLANLADEERLAKERELKAQRKAEKEKRHADRERRRAEKAAAKALARANQGPAQHKLTPKIIEKFGACMPGEDVYDRYLTRNEIQDQINDVNHAFALAALNAAIAAGDDKLILSWLSNPDTRVKDVLQIGHDLYPEFLKRALAEKRKNGDEKATLNLEEIQAAIGKANKEAADRAQRAKNEPKIIRLQALMRGILARREFEKLRAEAEKKKQADREAAALKIQTWYRAKKARRDYLALLAHYKDPANQKKIVKAQALWRGHKARKDNAQALIDFRKQVRAATLLQRAVRAWLDRLHYRKLMDNKKADVSTVRSFVHLLDQSAIDFNEELQLEKLRSSIVLQIRENQSLEKSLAEMDVKIGLLVRNRITLDQVVKESKGFLGRKKFDIKKIQEKGIGSLNKEDRERVQAYQHLFFLLQTNPVYLAKLVFLMPQSKTSKFMENVILTVFNYAQNNREEYLLLKLFKYAVEEEMERVSELKDMITGNPTVIKLVVHYNRGAKERTFLRELLQPLVKEILDDKGLLINTNPTEIYKAWINKQEVETGQPTTLPYDVTLPQALEHEHVRNEFAAHLKLLCSIATKFQNAIISSLDRLPYGIRYIAMQLRQVLQKKFPSSTREDLLKIIGNLIYYRFINPAIIAPDAFDVVDPNAVEALPPSARRNLGEVAKILQFASAGKVFEENTGYLSSINPFMKDLWEKFANFFDKASTVQDASEHFMIDEYSDLVMRTNPQIYISPREIINTHKLLVEHQDGLCTGDADPLAEQLKALGAPPSDEAVESDEGALAFFNSSDPDNEIMLTLTNKYSVKEDPQAEMRSLFIRTKRMLASIIRFQTDCSSIVDLLKTPAKPDQEATYREFVKQRTLQKQRMSMNPEGMQAMERSKSIFGDDENMSLEQMKQQLGEFLTKLEAGGLCTAANDYQELANAIAKDIRNQHVYRTQRKAEIKKLQGTLHSLESKRDYFTDQAGAYDEYLKKSMHAMASGGKPTKVAFFRQKPKKSEHAHGEYSLTAKKLKEKWGVLVSVEGVPSALLSTIKLTITSDEEGVFVFTIHPNVDEPVVLRLEELLQMQYEGKAIIKMFSPVATINVNLLLFMLNKKFFGK